VKAVPTNISDVLTKAMRAVANANDELRGVFAVDWSQPAPDASGKPLIPNEVVHALIQHFDEHDLSNKSVRPDILGRAYEYLIKQFADYAGAKAGEFFTPPEVVDTLVRILEPRPGDTVYDPTSDSGGMLVHAADYLRDHGQQATSADTGDAPPPLRVGAAWLKHSEADGLRQDLSPLQSSGRLSLTPIQVGRHTIPALATGQFALIESFRHGHTKLDGVLTQEESAALLAE
jgi:N-6 DNA Methylase